MPELCVIVTVDEALTHDIPIPVADLLPQAVEDGYEASPAGVQQWIEDGHLDADDEAIIDRIGDGTVSCVSERIVDPKAIVQQQETAPTATVTPQPADDYLVTWQINVDAGDGSWGAANPVEAAMRAGIILMGASNLADRMADPDAAVVFDVTDRRTGQTTRVDLADESGKCRTCNADTSDYAPDQQAACAVCAGSGPCLTEGCAGEPGSTGYCVACDEDARLIRKANDDTPEVW